MTPRISTPAEEGQFQAAKWLKIQALLSQSELAELLQLRGPTWFFPLAGLFPLDKVSLSKEEICSVYGSWIEGLKEGRAPSDAELRILSAVAWTESVDAVWLQEVPGNRYLVKPCAPVVQIQVHQMSYSSVDRVFRPMTLGQESIFWGLQFSFPQIYQHPKTMELREVESGELFQAIRRFIREKTVATPMMVEGKRVNLPMRLGKSCFSWINRHPQLLMKGVIVWTSQNSCTKS